MTALHPTKNDCHTVIDAAAAVGIREYDFFDLAYRRWSGRQAAPGFLEHAFADYMFHKIVPSWVRHLGREVLAREKAGTLDPAALGLETYRRHEPLPRLGWLNCAVSGAAAVAVYALIMAVFLFPGPPAGKDCAATGNRLFEAWVYTIAGKEKPPCDMQNPLR